MVQVHDEVDELEEHASDSEMDVHAEEDEVEVHAEVKVLASAGEGGERRCVPDPVQEEAEPANDVVEIMREVSSVVEVEVHAFAGEV